jgi:hypothetical protein
LPAPQKMHAAELDAPVAELYVPAELGGRRPAEPQTRGSATVAVTRP